MASESGFPTISTVLDGIDDDVGCPLYSEKVKDLVKKVLPGHLFSQEMPLEAAQDRLQALLPMLTYSTCSQLSSNISFCIISKHRHNSFKFFTEMIAHWLIPGKRLNVVMIYAADFRFPDLGSAIYTVCEVIVRLENREDVKQIQQNLPIIESEICLGMSSEYYARRILEIKGLSADSKTATIQEYIAYLMNRRPKDFDYEILAEMQHVLVMCRDDFKAARSCQHLSRIICVHYLFRKSLQESVRKAPEKRHLSLKLFKAILKLPTGQKKVLGLLVGINFLRDKEVFEKRHLLNAIQNYVPDAQAVEDSFFANRRGSEHICTLYLELEKGNGEDFTSEEVNTLRRELPST